MGFWVTESQKWTCQRLYDELKNDEKFEPFILLSYYKNKPINTDYKKDYNDTRSFFEGKGTKVFEVFDPDNYTFKDLMEFKPDIVFYQQPWQIFKNQHPENTHKHFLLCYVPYCFYSMESNLNYLGKFHGSLWKYFVETQMHKEEYEKLYKASNCVVSGSVKLDEYHFINSDNVEKYWKTKDKKRIIYAPHHSFNDGLHEVATFDKNGRFILEFAKSHPETEWIFRPHPVFKERVIKNSVMNEDEIADYYKEWEKIGSISTGGNYYEMFSSSDLLITDCISFLTEYAPVLKPVFHLRKDYQKENFNYLVTEIDKSYYQIYNNDEFAKIFEQVITNNDDYLKDNRIHNRNILPTDKLAYKYIYNYLKRELKLMSKK